ncbi:hypothetical protein ACFPYM_25095, partial [Methylobacterium hispanicum]
GRGGVASDRARAVPAVGRCRADGALLAFQHPARVNIRVRDGLTFGPGSLIALDDNRRLRDEADAML